MRSFDIRTYKFLERIRASAWTREEQDAIIEWKAGSMAVLRHYGSDYFNARGASKMQRQFTIELRVDFADPEKLMSLKQTLQQCARHAFATAQLISDNPKLTKIVIFSDDFFTGHEQIAMLDDTIQQGLDGIGEQSSGDAVSSELAAAVMEKR